MGKVSILLLVTLLAVVTYPDETLSMFPFYPPSPNFDVPKVENMILNTSSGKVYQKIYTWGGRGVSGQKLLYFDGQHITRDTSKDIDIEIGYYKTFFRERITQIQILADQTSSQAGAKLIYGGIGKCHVKVSVWAHKTCGFNTSFFVYGK